MKRAVCLLVCAALLLGGLTACADAERQLAMGDADGNARVNAADALVVLKTAVGRHTLNSFEAEAADVNEDAAIDALDALYILQYGVGKLTCFAQTVAFALPAAADLPDRPARIDDPLLMYNGRRVLDRQDWESQQYYRRLMLQHYIYGRMPQQRAYTAAGWQTTPLPESGATMLQTTLTFGRSHCTVRLCVPAGEGPFPLIMKLDYLSDRQYRSPLEDELLSAGRYAFAVVGRQLTAPDTAADRNDPTLAAYAAGDTGALALWAHACTLALDEILTLGLIDPDRVCLTGHSRDGKAVLLAAAFDTRFAAVAPNASGVGGAGSLRVPRAGSEPLAHLVQNFPHWFAGELASFADCPQKLPVDGIDLQCLIAPRAILRTEARNDAWSDPAGTAANRQAMDAVYAFLGAPAQRNTLVTRPGEHGMERADWQAVVDFCDRVFA